MALWIHVVSSSLLFVLFVVSVLSHIQPEMSLAPGWRVQGCSSPSVAAAVDIFVISLGVCKEKVEGTEAALLTVCLH